MVERSRLRSVARPEMAWKDRVVRWITKTGCRLYMRTWHGMHVEGVEYLPPRGPALVLINHASTLDIVALLAVSPYGDATMVAKSSLFHSAFLAIFLHAHQVISVARDGRDTAGLRSIMRALGEGRIITVAAEGHRSATGRLDPINPVLARIALTAGVPAIPLGIGGSYAALPPGTLIPRRSRINLRFGPPISFPPGAGVEDARALIRDAISRLLPPESQPVAAWEMVRTARDTAVSRAPER